MTILNVLLTLALGSGFCSGDETLTLVRPGAERSYSLSQLRAKLPVRKIEVDDTLYNKRMTYDGFALADILGLMGPVPAGVDAVFFTSKDGYSPGLPLSNVRSHQAFVTFGEHGNKKRWTPVHQGKALLDPAPFYVVWVAGPGEQLGQEEYPRSYQLVRIELVGFETKYPKVYPHGVAADSAEMKGFAIFRTKCLACHSVNLEGGAIGPELNVPRNVTEYWKKDELAGLIHKVSDYRAKSKMPDFDKELTTDDVVAILDYLAFMKDHKK